MKLQAALMGLIYMVDSHTNNKSDNVLEMAEFFMYMAFTCDEPAAFAFL